jgi:radical SAM protein with 4Fe4S-binding SPASM domain
MKEKKVLSLKVIENVLEELAEYGFAGAFYPFVYSEPLIDPRFFKIVEMSKEIIPLADVWIYSNGFMVDDNMLEDLVEVGVDRINFSVYSEEEGIYIHEMIKRYKRHHKDSDVVLKAYCRYPFCQNMNDKIYWSEKEAINSTRSCPSPLRYLTINSYGEVVICCHDWQRKHVFGNVNKQPLKEILQSEEVIETFEALTRGERFKFDLCSRCDKHR